MPTWAETRILRLPARPATDFGMFMLGVSDPRLRDAASRMSDARPHLAYG
jgi:hypothetical protein